MSETKAAGASGVLLIILTLAGWTAVPLLIEEFTKDVDGWTSNGWRYGFAALIWSPLLLWKALKGTWSKGLLAAALVPGSINAASQIAFTMSFYEIDPSLMAFGLRFQIIAVTVGAAILFPTERRVIKHPLFLVGIGLLLAGLIATAVLQERPETEGDDGNLALGVGLAVLAGGGFGAYAIAVRWFMKRFGVMESFAAVSQYTAVSMIVLMLFVAERNGAVPIEMTPSRFGLFLLSAVVGIAAGHVLYYASIQKLGVTVSSGIIQLQPFTVSLAALAVYGSAKAQLSPLQWITGIVAVAGAILMLIVQSIVARKIKGDRLPETDIDEFAELPPDPVQAMAISQGEREDQQDKAAEPAGAS
ncbi:MAG: DMT family transporter [Planctomycetota bacterium]